MTKATEWKLNRMSSFPPPTLRCYLQCLWSEQKKNRRFIYLYNESFQGWKVLAITYARSIRFETERQARSSRAGTKQSRHATFDICIYIHIAIRVHVHIYQSSENDFELTAAHVHSQRTRTRTISFDVFSISREFANVHIAHQKSPIRKSGGPTRLWSTQCARWSTGAYITHLISTRPPPRSSQTHRMACTVSPALLLSSPGHSFPISWSWYSCLYYSVSLALLILLPSSTFVHALLYTPFMTLSGSDRRYNNFIFIPLMLVPCF